MGLPVDLVAVAVGPLTATAAALTLRQVATAAAAREVGETLATTATSLILAYGGNAVIKSRFSREPGEREVVSNVHHCHLSRNSDLMQIHARNRVVLQTRGDM